MMLLFGKTETSELTYETSLPFLNELCTFCPNAIAMWIVDAHTDIAVVKRVEGYMIYIW